MGSLDTMKSSRKIRRLFHIFIHLNFVTGLLYAFTRFISTPRVLVLHRRLWAYETWIIFSFYAIFLFLLLHEADLDLTEVLDRVEGRLIHFKEVMLVNLLLLVFPWGLFLLLGPASMLNMLGLWSFYWRVLGFFSLVGALLYYLPFRFYKKKITYYILIFGFVDNFVAGVILFFLLIRGKISLVAFSATPLLFYFALTFLEQARHWSRYRSNG